MLETEVLSDAISLVFPTRAGVDWREKLFGSFAESLPGGFFVLFVRSGSIVLSSLGDTVNRGSGGGFLLHDWGGRVEDGRRSHRQSGESKLYLGAVSLLDLHLERVLGLDTEHEEGEEDDGHEDEGADHDQVDSHLLETDVKLAIVAEGLRHKNVVALFHAGLVFLVHGVLVDFGAVLARRSLELVGEGVGHSVIGRAGQGLGRLEVSHSLLS
mmetsp:Transcript_17816/g.27573  ORF Transcript_17816/g.27573 Transcript_17816/m.27573 type:complete len:213 (-) Transcript_17816:543-1181(-)